MDEQNKGIEVDITDMQDEAIEAELKAEAEPSVAEEQTTPTMEEVKDATAEHEDAKPDEVVEEKLETNLEAEVDKPADSVEPTTTDVKEEDKVDAEPETKEVEPEPEPESEPVVEEVSELDKIKAELEEVKAIREEEKDIKEFETRMRADEIQMDNVRSVLADQLTRALKDIGVDLNTTMEELEKANPDKAARAKQFLAEVQRIEAYEQQKREQARNERLQEIVFKRAGRLFDKYKLTDEEGDLAAETFVNILHEVGLKDLDDDLVAKVELAVGRTKLLVDRAKGVVKEVKEIAKEAVDIVNDVMTPAPEVNPDEEKVKEDLAKKEEAVVKEEEPEPEPTIDVSAFEEGAPSTVSAPIGEKKDILAELESITSTKERVAFYSEHAKEIEAALKEKYNK